MDPELARQLIELGRITIPLAATIIAGILGYRFGLARLRRETRLAFLERQVSDLYSPIVGLAEEIRAKSLLRVEISGAANAAWQEIVRTRPEVAAGDGLDDKRDQFMGIIEYNNAQLGGDLLPTYNRMLDVFREKYWLANPTTREWYYEFVKYVEVWNRWINDSLPSEVIEELGHGEASLQPFYDHLRDEVARIRRILADE